MQSTSNISGNNEEGVQIGQNSGNVFYLSSDRRATGPASDEATKFIQGLSSPYRQQKEMVARPAPGTCKWVVDDASFCRWCESANSRLFHILAGPGCGKSVITKHLVDTVLPSKCNGSAVLYFFFKSGQGDQDRATSALSSMLHQLFTRDDDANVQIHAIPKYKVHGDKLFTMFSELWSIFLETIRDMSRIIICVFDALDECAEEDRNLIMHSISKFYTDAPYSTRSTGTPKFLFTSRPYQEVDFDYWAMGEHSNVVKLDGDDKSESIQSEIKRAIEVRVPLTIPKASNRVKSAIVEHLQSKNNRTYLWLDLILDYMRSNSALHGTEIKLKRLLEQLPSTIYEAYEKMLQRSKDGKRARRLLSITLAARRPLTLTETQWALEMKGTKHRFVGDFDLESYDVFRESVRNICGLLLSVHDSKVYFLHETAREFLICKDMESSLSSSLSWKHSISSADAEFVIAEACVLYLSLEEFQDEPPWKPEMGHGLRLWLLLHPLSGYAARWWDSHVRLTEMEILSTLRESLLRILPGNSRAFKTWLPLRRSYNSYVSVEGITPLRFAAEHGLSHSMNILIDGGADVNRKDSDSMTPLRAASEHGQIEAVRLLLQKGAKVNRPKGESAPSALAAASKGGHLEIMRMLIHHGADVNAMNWVLDGDSALLRAVQNGQTEAVKLLLESGAVVHAQEKTYGYALMSLVEKGSLDIIRVLNERRAKSVALQQHYQSALVAATEDALEEVIDFFLQNGSDINRVCRGQKTVLQAAIWRSDLTFLDFVLSRGADPCLYGGLYHSPLTAALMKGDILVVERLFHAGVPETIICPFCASYTSESLLLFEKHVYHPDDTHYVTALLVAAQRGSPRLVRYLLEREPSIDAYFEDTLNTVRGEISELDGDPLRRMYLENILQLLSEYKARSSDKPV